MGQTYGSGHQVGLGPPDATSHCHGSTAPPRRHLLLETLKMKKKKKKKKLIPKGGTVSGEQEAS